MSGVERDRDLPGVIEQTPESFEILGFETRDERGLAIFHYCFRPGTEFSETLDFGRPFPPASSAAGRALRAAFDALSVLIGVSYYKAFVPPRIDIRIPGLTDAQLAFFRDIYVEGLGEFAYRNNIDIESRVNFTAPTAITVAAEVAPVNLARRSAVLIGGGKDSLVSIEMLRAAGEPMTLFAVNPKTPILRCAEASGLPLISVARTLDPKLFELNKAGAFNGHVPITTIISFIAAAAGFIHDFDTVILSNERSANEETIARDGKAINHQFSKTSGVESSIQHYIRTYIAPELSYFSLLRPLSEAHIGQLFARSTRYDSVFTSCNQAFRLGDDTGRKRWCGDCPKCRFTYLILAVAMPRSRLDEIFGMALLDDPAQLPGYRELTGLGGQKPWECVGEIAESGAAILRLARDEAWKDTLVIRSLAPALAERMPNDEAVWAQLLTPSPEHYLPPRFEKMVDEYAGTR